MEAKPKKLAVLFFSGCLLLCTSAAAQGRRMQLLAPDTGWLLAGEKLLWTADNGQHWTDATPPMSLPDVAAVSREKIANVYFKDANDGWVLLSTDENDHGGEARFELASTVNSGASWSVSPVEVPDRNLNRRPLLPGGGAIFFLDARHGWLNLFLESGQSSSISLFLATEDGGNTWTRKAQAHFGAIRFTTPEVGWIAGGAGGQYLYGTRDGGSTWQGISLKAPRTTGSAVYPLYEAAPTFTNAMHGLLPVTYMAPEDLPWALVLFATEDGGLSWSAGKVLTGLRGAGNLPFPSAIADSTWLMARPDISTLTLTISRLGPDHGGVETRMARIERQLLPTGGLAPVFEISFATEDLGWIRTDRILATADRGETWKDITPLPAARKEPAVPVPPARPEAGEQTPPLSSVEPLSGRGGGGSPHHTSLHMGLDLCATPSTSTMATWWSHSPYYDAGVYIGGVNTNCVIPGSTTAQRANWVTGVTGYGWGLMPLWVGLQPPCTSGFSTFSSLSGNAATEAIVEADNAASVAASLGLGNSVIYYDLEYYDPTALSGQCGAATDAFVGAWVNELHLDGYVAGVYGSSLDAGDWFLLATPRPDVVWISRYDRRLTIWNLSHDENSIDDILDSEWTNNQRGHQYYAGPDNVSGVTETWGNVPIKIDQDIEALTVAGGQGSKTFSNWTFTTINYTGNYVGSPETRAYGANDAGADLSSCTGPSSICDLIGGSAGSNLGTIVGDVAWEDSNVYATNAFATISCTGWPQTQVYGVNNLRQFVGGVSNAPNVPSGQSLMYQGFIYTDSAGCTPFTFNNTGANTVALGINDASQIVGYYYDSSGAVHGFFYDTNMGTFTSFDYPGVPNSTELTGINGQGQVAGYYYNGSNEQPFIWNHASDGSHPLIPITDKFAFVQFGINGNGWVVGPGATKTGVFLYSDGQVSAFPLDPNNAPKCTACDFAYGINNYGRVVGQYVAAGMFGFWAVGSP